jgi:hypothetical protein
MESQSVVRLNLESTAREISMAKEEMDSVLIAKQRLHVCIRVRRVTKTNNSRFSAAEPDSAGFLTCS